MAQSRRKTPLISQNTKNLNYYFYKRSYDRNNFFTIPEAIQNSKFLNATANITKTVSKKAYNITLKIGKVSLAFGTEAIEGITDASIDILGGENQNETAKDVLNSTLEKISRGGHINVDGTVIGISSAILIERGLKAVPSIIINGCPNLLY